MRDAVIVSAVRTAIGKGPHGALHTVRPDELAAIVIREALRRAPGLDPEVSRFLLLVPQTLDEFGTRAWSRTSPHHEVVASGAGPGPRRSRSGRGAPCVPCRRP